MDEIVNFGLITGNDIISHSPFIHRLIADLDYKTVKLSIDELNEFFIKKAFKGVNITIPYKNTVLTYIDELDEVSKTTNAVNTIVNKDGKLFGYNTDYHGFIYLLDYYKIDIKDKIVLILGTGATSKTVKNALLDKKAKSVTKVSRSKKGENIINYEDINSSFDIVINTTPIKDKVLINLDIVKPSIVIDVNYNPLYSSILLEAKKRKIRVINGLMMLVAQAFYADQLFVNKKLDTNIISEVYKKVKSNISSIALIGVSYSGKSILAKEFSNKFGFRCIDIDELIEQSESLKIADIFTQYGEEYFRNLEKKMIKENAFATKSIISLGGGAVLDEENLNCLKSNCLIIYIKRNINDVVLSNDRPLVKSKEDLCKLEKIRAPLYEKYCDVIIENNDKIDEVVNKIKEVYDEYLSY